MGAAVLPSPPSWRRDDGPGAGDGPLRLASLLPPAHGGHFRAPRRPHHRSRLGPRARPRSGLAARVAGRRRASVGDGGTLPPRISRRHSPVSLRRGAPRVRRPRREARWNWRPSDKFGGPSARRGKRAGSAASARPPAWGGRPADWPPCDPSQPPLLAAPQSRQRQRRLRGHHQRPWGGGAASSAKAEKPSGAIRQVRVAPLQAAAGYCESLMRGLLHHHRKPGRAGGGHPQT